MANILFCWELGSGLGHIAPIQQLSERLIKLGHTVYFAAKNIELAKSQLKASSVHVIQAPKLSPPVNDKPNDMPKGSLCYADILYTVGYYSVGGLVNAIVKWRNLIDDVQPDLLIMDYSPTALLSAKDLGILTIGMGSPFYFPPKPENNQPLGSFSHQPVHVQRSQAQELTVLNNINSARSQLELPSIRNLHSIFDGLQDIFVQTYPEFDHYGRRDSIRYCGTAPMPVQHKPQWPGIHDSGPKIFCYYKKTPSFRILIEAIQAISASVIVVNTGLSNTEAIQLSSEHVTIYSDPVDMISLLRETDLFIGYAGLNTIGLCLKAGVPLALNSQYFEQEINLRRVEKYEMGSRLAMTTVQNCIDSIQLALNPKYRQRASLFEAKYREVESESALDNVAERLHLRLSQIHA